MITKTSARILVAVTVLGLLIFAATREESIQEIALVEVYTNQSDPKIVLSNTQIIKRAGEYSLVGDLLNSSVIPVTLVVIEVVCSEGAQRDKYTITSAVSTKNLKTKDTLDGDKVRAKQIVPARIQIGETFVFESVLNNFNSTNKVCIAEVKNWSKYEPN